MQLSESGLVSSVGVDTSRRRAVIIGAGPAGLTAALELLRRTDVIPIVLEKSHAMGGISRTVNSAKPIAGYAEAMRRSGAYDDRGAGWQVDCPAGLVV